MRADNDDVMQAETKPPCFVCGQPGKCVVWDVQLCGPCTGDWSFKSPTYGDLEAEFGPEVDAPAAYRAWTARWLEKRKAGQVAA